MGYKIVFSEMKSKVGLLDVADSLGYSLNRKAGVGKYLELNLGPVSNPIDTIIVRNSTSKDRQTFFRRNGTKGDVITLIRENLNSFNVPGENEWIRTANVLASFANMPYIDNRIEQQSDMQNNLPQKFDPERYHTLNVIPENPHWILKKRGFTNDTVNEFKDKIVLIRDTKMTNFDGYNIGFPYVNPFSDKLSGYEIRGGAGFKSKASGTDSTNAFWTAEFIRKPNFNISHVYLFESGFDAMAFYQVNKERLKNVNCSLVSFGGAFSQSQVEMLQWKYRDQNAIYFDCFDNDLAGNVYSANLARCMDGIPVKIDYKGTGDAKQIIMSIGDKVVTTSTNNFNFEAEAKKAGVKYKIQHWKPPGDCKDWNDCLHNPAYMIQNTVSKYERDRNLANNRKQLSL